MPFKFFVIRANPPGGVAPLGVERTAVTVFGQILGESKHAGIVKFLVSAMK